MYAAISSDLPRLELEPEERRHRVAPRGELVPVGDRDAQHLGDHERRDLVSEAREEVDRFSGIELVEQTRRGPLDEGPEPADPPRRERPRHEAAHPRMVGRIEEVDPVRHLVPRRPGRQGREVAERDRTRRRVRMPKHLERRAVAGHAPEARRHATDRRGLPHPAEPRIRISLAQLRGIEVDLDAAHFASR
jgi:hypothetical protein